MKKKSLLILPLIFCLFFKTNAQVDVFRHTADSLFQHLDKTGIITGVLYDRIFPVAALHDFNLAAPDTSSMWHFIQAYSEFYRSAYNPPSNWLTVNQLKEKVAMAKIQHQVPIALGNFQFNVIDSNSISLGLISLNPGDSLYYDVGGRSRHPFNIVNTFVAGALADSVALGSVTYKIAPEFTFNCSNRTLSNLSVDFGDGLGLQNVNLNGNKVVYYGTTGYIALKFVATFSDNTTITTYSALKIFGELSGQNQMRNANSCNTPTTFDIWSKLSFQGYDESMATKGKGDVTVYHSAINNCDGIIRKPIIVIDGFDPEDKQIGTKLYDDYLNNEQKGKLGDSLRNRGYDIFILNFPAYDINGHSRDGGADYIERNARVLMALIDTVNVMKQGNEKLVIIGPSMGGLISRYALAYMEQHQMPHHTRLWISFDSPHKGANIPIGDQRWLDFFGRRTGSEEIISKRDGKIGSVAAKQMLISHYLSPSSGGAPGFRNQFLSNINSLGFPVGDSGQPFRKIALVDGGLGGNEINSPGQKGFTFDVRRYRKRLFMFKARYTTFTVAAARMYFTPSYGGQNAVFDGWFLGKAEIHIVNAAANSSGVDVAPGGIFDTQKQIADGGDGVITKSFGLAFMAKFYSVIPNHSFINTKSALAFNGTNQDLSENISERSLVCTGETPFDSYFGDFSANRDHVELWPSGIQYVLKEIDGSPQLPLVKNQGLTISGPSQSGNSTTYSISNIPAGATVKWEVTSPYSINGPDTANPVGVIIPTNHTQFSQLVATVKTNCYQTKVYKALVPPKITTGLSSNGGAACGEGYATVNVPSGFNFVWIATGDIYIEGTVPPDQPHKTTSNTINISGTSGTIMVFFESYGNSISTSEVYEPYKRDVVIESAPGNRPLNANIQYPNFDYTNIIWYVNGNQVDPYGYDSKSFTETEVPCGIMLTISADAVLPCGATVHVGSAMTQRNCYAWRHSMIIYPNPADTETNVGPSEKEYQSERNGEAVKPKEYDAWLYDKQGKLRFTGKSRNLQINLNTQKLPSDTYFLHIRITGEKEIIKKQLVVKH